MTTAVDGRPPRRHALRKEFPLLQQESHGHRLVYLDSAASSQRPRAVLDAMDHYYETTHANVHRGVYAIAEEATRQFEMARSAVGTVHPRAEARHARSCSRRTPPRRSTSSPTPTAGTFSPRARRSC